MPRTSLTRWAEGGRRAHFDMRRRCIQFMCRERAFCLCKAGAFPEKSDKTWRLRAPAMRVSGMAPDRRIDHVCTLNVGHGASSAAAFDRRSGSVMQQAVTPMEPSHGHTRWCHSFKRVRKEQVRQVWAAGTQGRRSGRGLLLTRARTGLHAQEGPVRNGRSTWVTGLLTQPRSC